MLHITCNMITDTTELTYTCTAAHYHTYRAFGLGADQTWEFFAQQWYILA